MCSWAVVCDVYYLEPMRIQPGENGIAFSNRVKKLIAEKAGLRNVSYDGYLKHFEVKQSLIEKQQKMYADVILKRLTPEEQAEIALEEAEATERAASHTPIASPVEATASVPDSLALSPSPEVVMTKSSLNLPKSKMSRSVSNPQSSSSPTSIPNINSSADLMALLNEVQAAEREEELAATGTQGETQIKQRKVHPINVNNQEDKSTQ